MRTPEEWGELAKRFDAAAALYGSAKRWALASLAAYVGMVVAGSAFGSGDHRWVTWVLCIIGAGCMTRSVALTRRAGKLLKVLP